MSDAIGMIDVCECPCHRDANRCMECCDSNTARLEAERDTLKAEVAEHEAHWSPIPTTREQALEAEVERLRAEVASITDRSLNRSNTIESLNKRLTELREAALALACEHMGMGGNEELLLWLETLPATDPGHDTPWGRFFAVLAKLPK